MVEDNLILTQSRYDINIALSSLSPYLIDNPIFKFELAKIVKDYDKDISVAVYDNGKRLVVSEKPTKSVSDNLDTISSSNYCITLTPNLDLISTRQHGVLSRDHNVNKKGEIKYEMESCLFTFDGIELNRVIYNTHNSMNTANDFKETTLAREINNRTPQVTFSSGSLSFKPGLYAFNGNVVCYSRRVDSLGITNVLWKKLDGANFLNSHIDERILEDSIYQVSPYQPGVIRTYGDALNRTCKTKGQLKGMIDSANMQLYNQANDYGADAVKEYMNKYMNFERKIY